ncbi:hypothetical protein BUALT_Bualt15G0120300 [Buddleja alternifolia]|uniref:BHLH domain-containing protein n=1 Tax=Buddleja alternifolia TaxID=168488 RepID=A0AAV6WMS3_9LAMI|nr:hypothetical protein BUALT_Bualt15G0120300 [Buddleja alternifolia]
MGSEENGDRAYQQKIGCSVMATNSMSDHFYSSGWDQSENFGNEFVNPHYSHVIEHQKMGNSSHLVHFPSNSGLVDLLPKIPSFGSGSLSEMVSSFEIPRADSLENGQNSENGKRKRKLSGGVSSKNVEVEHHKDPSGNTSEFPNEDDGNKNVAGNSCSKQLVQQAKGSNSNDAEPSKENYIHVRAKRGQATNSHSLAERVRREKISERMKLLQELVPGCDKITGKAVMLDEIINYVQSLQQQVEFLSMKLATVNPELNVDIDRILSKDILHSRGNNATALGLGPGLSSSHPFQGFLQGTLNGVPSATPPFHSLPQNSWNNELQSILQMGFDSNSSISRLGPNGNCLELYLHIPFTLSSLVYPVLTV